MYYIQLHTATPRPHTQTHTHTYGLHLPLFRAPHSRQSYNSFMWMRLTPAAHDTSTVLVVVGCFSCSKSCQGQWPAVLSVTVSFTEIGGSMKYQLGGCSTTFFWAQHRRPPHDRHSTATPHACSTLHYGHPIPAVLITYLCHEACHVPATNSARKHNWYTTWRFDMYLHNPTYCWWTKSCTTLFAP